jgi:putative spermidine/putrescine transport system permease protein
VSAPPVGAHRLGAAGAPPARRQGRHGAAALLLTWPTLALLATFLVPLLLLVRTSLARRDPAVFQGTGFSFQPYVELAQPLVVDSIVFSIVLAFVVAVCSLLVATTAAYFICRLGPRGQTAWLIAILSTLALSEVLIAFAWQVLLSRRAGLSNVAVWFGLIDEPVSLSPSLGAVVACMVYFVLPFTFMTLYPAMSRLDRAFMEAAQTMGAHPLRAFIGVVVPNLRRPIVTAVGISAILTLGAFVPPLVLGKPANWTVGVVISEVALSGQNLPLAAAIALLLMVLALGLVAGLGRLAGGRGRPG